MSLAEILQADAAFVLADLAAEDALYLPDGGTPRLIQVAIDRESETVNTDPRASMSPMTVFARNSAAAGISGPEVGPNDQLRLAKVKGGEHVRMRIKRVVDENPGWIEMEVA